MADKAASVRLTLKGDGFKRGMSEAEAQGAKSAKTIGATFKSALTEGGKAGFDALKTSMSKIADAAKGFLGIAGGIGIAEFGKKALQNESSFRKMAFQIKAGTGALVDWKDLQKEAQATALQFGHSTEDVAASMGKLRSVSGDTTFARAASKTVAEMATGSHESLATMTDLAAGLNEKFGITDKQMGSTLASVVQLGNEGGVTVEELSEKINLMGAGAKQAGFDGQAGFEKMARWIQIAHGATGNMRKGISAVSGIIDGLASSSLRMPVLQHAGYDIDAAKKAGKDFNTILGDIIAKTGGKQERLAQMFSGEQLKVVTDLGKTYSKAFADTTGDVKTKTAAGLAAYGNALKATGDASKTEADIKEEAAKEMETPEKKIAVALEKLAQLFTSDKMMKAFGALADLMPKVVDAIAAHPLISGALWAGIPQAVAGAVLSGLMAGMLKGGGPGGGGGMPGGGAGNVLAAGAAGAALGWYIGEQTFGKYYDKKDAQLTRSLGEEASARNALSAMRTGQAAMTGDQRRSNASAIRARRGTISDQLDDVEFASIGGAHMGAERRKAAQSRAAAGTAFSGSDEQVSSLKKQFSDLTDALEVRRDIGAQARGNIAAGRGSTADVDAFAASLSSGGPNTKGGFVDRGGPSLAPAGMPDPANRKAFKEWMTAQRQGGGEAPADPSAKIVAALKEPLTVRVTELPPKTDGPRNGIFGW